MLSVRQSNHVHIETRELVQEHHAALVGLLETSSTGSDQFRVDRSRDYFALGRAIGDTRHYGAFAAGQLIGSLALSQQKRFIGAVPKLVTYAHDVRIHPEHRGRGLFHRFLMDVIRTHPDHPRWLFCSVLDTNPHAGTVRNLAKAFGPEHVLGHTIHVGMPLAGTPAVPTFEVLQVSAEQAWDEYVGMASGKDMAPADRDRFLAKPAEHLIVTHGTKTVAVATWLDQSIERQILAPLPDGTQQIVPIAYLSHFASRTSEPRIAHELAAFMHRTHPGRHTHVFLGVTQAGSRFFQGTGTVKLTSTTFAYGAVPPNLTLGFRELSWT